MYTKQELLENKKIEEAIKENKKKYKVIKKKHTFVKVLDILLYITSCGLVLFGLMFLIAVIEHLKF